MNRKLIFTFAIINTLLTILNLGMYVAYGDKFSLAVGIFVGLFAILYWFIGFNKIPADDYNEFIKNRNLKKNKEFLKKEKIKKEKEYITDMFYNNLTDFKCSQLEIEQNENAHKTIKLNEKE